MHLKEDIHSAQQTIKDTFSQVDSDQALEQARVAILGRNGLITNLMAQLKTLTVDEKRVCGPLLNELKQLAQDLYDQTAKRLEHATAAREAAAHSSFDVTAYHVPASVGTLHIYTRVVEQLEDIFISMGYTVLEGPELETDYYNFGALNIPEEHPARDMHDTFWLTLPGMLLRTHTSTVQIRGMEAQRPPMALFAPGRVYRNEAVDASHSFVFHQGEILFIDKQVSLANLLATAESFLRAIFERDDIRIRVRPGYFPFVEPGIEIDASCLFCTQGCSVCKRTGWIELLGAGLVHPNVLRAGGINPEEYSGFAVGFGIERIAMLKYGITDIRLFHSSKLGFLNQF